MVSSFFTKSNSLFVCKFLGISLLLVVALDSAPVLSKRDYITHFLAAASCFVVQQATPGEACLRRNATLVSQNTPVIVVTKECDGLNALILLTAAILSFPCPIRFKAAGLLLGYPLLLVCNVLRISCLFYVNKYYYASFDIIHTLVAPMATIMPTVVFYFIWLGCVSKFFSSRV